MKKYIYTSLMAIAIVIMQLPQGLAQDFKSEAIPSKILQAMRQGGTLRDDSPVPQERLRLLTVKHIDFAGHVQTGQLIVLDVCDDMVLEIFKALYARRFPIHKMQLMYHYQGNDHASMADNNTSCYNDRSIIGNNQKKSLHAYGVAIDINPVQNPFVVIDQETGTATYDPKAGIQYANRRLVRLGQDSRKGMAEEIVDLLAKHGFYEWGGYWDAPLDYHHFQLSSSLTELYLVMKPQTAKITFQKATQYFNKYKQPLEQELMQQLQREQGSAASLADYYKKNKKLFDRVLQQLTQGLEKYDK